MRIHLFSPSPIVSASGGCCILNSVMISPTTLTKRSRSSTNCSRSPWPRNTSWLMTVSFFLLRAPFGQYGPVAATWALSVYRSRLAPWTRGESNHGKLSVLRPLGHGRYRFATASAELGNDCVKVARCKGIFQYDTESIHMHAKWCSRILSFI